MAELVRRETLASIGDLEQNEILTILPIFFPHGQVNFKIYRGNLVGLL